VESDFRPGDGRDDREPLRRAQPTDIIKTLDLANAIVAAFERRGEKRAVNNVCSLIRLEAAALSISVRDRRAITIPFLEPSCVPGDFQ
jgi:hypothetical protein